MPQWGITIVAAGVNLRIESDKEKEITQLPRAISQRLPEAFWGEGCQLARIPHVARGATQVIPFEGIQTSLEMKPSFVVPNEFQSCGPDCSIEKHAELRRELVSTTPDVRSVTLP